MRHTRTGAAFALSLATFLATLPITAGPAAASGNGAVERSGPCSGSAHWKLKVKHDDGRMEVEAEVDSNRNGQIWRWSLRHDGNLSARGTRTTRPASGSFEVHRRLVDLAGTDKIVFRARQPRTGQVCRGTVHI
jgi:hypothetical protein